MHSKNLHKGGYNFITLIKSSPALATFVIKNKFNQQPTIDFSNPDAVKALNSALLKSHYDINYWGIPKGYLCPPIPGRVDYIHHLNDLLCASAKQLPKERSKIHVLDIGTGASCIYPILGAQVYDWQFVASDIDPISIKEANKIVSANQALQNKIECRLQGDAQLIFNNIIAGSDFFHLTICNPPFHGSLAEATKGTKQKWQSLSNSSKIIKHNKDTLNFGGQKAELWCEGGELAFISKMIKESKQYQNQVLWFTCLVSKKEHVSKLKLRLKKASARQIKVVKMAQGHKISRFIAWSFFESDQLLNNNK